MNASKEIIVGLFTFPLELFAPSGDPFVLVVVGKTRNVEISMTPEQLGELR
jgi:uncharacterized protein (DUF433 family)